jgi:hypothetical protein
MKEIVSDDRDFLYFNICFTIIKERVLYIQKYIMSIWTYLQKRKFTNLLLITMESDNVLKSI